MKNKPNYKFTRIINYLRKSRQDIARERQTGEDTLANQEKLMDKVLLEIGIPYETRKEIGSGDKIETRPVFREILKEIKDYKYDAIAVREISRLGRGSYSDMGEIMDTLTEMRVFIITPYKIYDITNPSDMRQIRFELFFAREEFETIRERLTSARYNMAMEGKWVAGSPPYGYLYNSKTQRLEPHPTESKVVKLMFDLYVNGYTDEEGNKKDVSFKAISTILTRAGYPTASGKKEWSYFIVKRMIQNTTYIGQIKFRTTQRKNRKEVVERPKDEHIIVDNAHEPLIDLETFYKAQEKFKQRKQTDNTKLDFSPCELAGIFKCAVCGRKMIRQFSVQTYKKKDGTFSKYEKEFLWCRTNGCTFLKYRDVEFAILDYLNFLTDLDKDMLSDMLQSSIDNMSKNDNSTVEELKSQIEIKKKDIKNRLEFVYQKYESNIYSDEEFIERRDSLNKELEELEMVSIPKDENQSSNKPVDMSLIQDNLTSILDIYNSLSNKTSKNKLLRSVLDYVVLEITEKGAGRRKAKFNMTPYLNINFLDSESLDV